MSGLQFGIYEDPGGSFLLTDLPAPQGLTFGSNRHGYAALSCFLPMSLQRAFYLYDHPGFPHVEVNWHGGRVWEGRLEDRAIVPGGVRLGAFGYQRAYHDVPYTAAWSVTSLADWEQATLADRSDAFNERFQIDFNNRIYIAPRSGETFGITTATKACLIGLFIPHGSSRQWNRITFDFSWKGIDVNWLAECYRIDSAWGNQGNLWSLASTAGTQTGSQAINFAANAMDGVMFAVYRNAADAVLGGNTGDIELKITNVRVQTTNSASAVYAGEIIQGIINVIQPINPTQIRNIGALIQSTGLDLGNEVYQDTYPSDIFNRLALLGDNQSPPRQWEWGVDDRILYFRPKGDAASTWYVDVTALEPERTLETLYNSVYATYQEASGRTLRSAISVNQPSIDRYGLTRRAAVPASTTSSTQANSHRDAALEDMREPQPRIGIAFRELYDASGARWPLWVAKAHDVFVIRNLPPTLSSDIDRIRTFRSGEVSYDVDSNTLTVMPEQPLSMAEMLAARVGAIATPWTPRPGGTISIDPIRTIPGKRPGVPHPLTGHPILTDPLYRP